MKKLIWKLKYAYCHNKFLRAGYRLAWVEADAILEDVMNGDTSDSDPRDAAEETVEEWRACV